MAEQEEQIPEEQKEKKPWYQMSMNDLVTWAWKDAKSWIAPEKKILPANVIEFLSSLGTHTLLLHVAQEKEEKERVLLHQHIRDNVCARLGKEYQP